MKKQRILFFTPTLERTGSEIALFNLINHCHQEFDMNMISKITGELVSQLPAPIKHKTLEYTQGRITIMKSISNKINPPKKNFEEISLGKIHQLFPSDFWYVNTITFPGVLQFAMENEIPLLLHIHELEHMFAHLTEGQLKTMVQYPSLIIACSETCAGVIKKSGRQNNLIVSFPAIDFKKIIINAAKSNHIRKKNNINDETFVWVMSGTMDPNKNPSLFVDIAEGLLQRSDNTKFMWITGGAEDTGYAAYCRSKAYELGIADKIIWTPKLSHEYYDYFNAGNGYILCSTYESFSMVSAESLYLGKPVVSFNCGGINEILNDQTGIIVDDHSMDSIIGAMMKIMRKEFQFDSDVARYTVMKFDVSNQAVLWSQTLKSFPSYLI